MKLSFQTNVSNNLALPSPASLPTKDRLLDVTEGLVAEHGFDGVSLRQITTEAGTNLAAVNYHFGSREALFQEVFTRRVDRYSPL